MENVRILAGFLTASYGGVERYMVENFRRLNRTEFSMDFLTSASRVPFEEELRQAGLAVPTLSRLTKALQARGIKVPFSRNPMEFAAHLKKALEGRQNHGDE